MSLAAQRPGGGRKSLSHFTKQDLSASRSGLLELMQDTGFGRVEGLNVLAGEPVLDPPPRVIREVKFGGENGPRPERDVCDFLLKTQVVELFEYFDQMGDDTIELLEIKHGLPFRMYVARPAG